MAAALRLVHTDEVAVTRVGPRAGSGQPSALLPVVRAGDEEHLAPLWWFEIEAPGGVSFCRKQYTPVRN